MLGPVGGIFHSIRSPGRLLRNRHRVREVERAVVRKREVRNREPASRRWFLRAGLMAALPAAVRAQDPQARGRQIIEETIQALGGEKFLSVRNRVESGRAYSFFNEQLSGLAVAKFYTRYIAEPDAGEKLAQQERQAFGKNEDYFVILREEGGWEVTFRGPRPLEADQIRRHHDSVLHNIFYILRTRLKEPGLVFEARGGDVIDNMAVDVVDVIDSRNRVVTVYIQKATKLPMRQDWTWRDPRTRERNDELTRFARYREVAGTQWPFQMHRERNGLKIYEMFADSVAINQNLSDAVFAIPAPGARPK